MLIVGIMVVVFALAFAVGYFVRRRAQGSRCPHCGKAFAMREVSRNSVSSYETTTHVGLITRDLKGYVTGNDTRIVPARAHIYNCVDACRFCGFQKEEQRTQVHRQ
ncbi:MAG: hypothetical protein IJB75_06585 [Oscillospiraceae bacterium]|nr:hypothetical protein [Oscillospiraceae bacterium]